MYKEKRNEWRMAGLCCLLCGLLLVSACSRRNPATNMQDKPIQANKLEEKTSLNDPTDTLENKPPDPLAKDASPPLRFSDGPFAGQPIPAGIKGSDTLLMTAILHGIPLEELAAAFLIPIDKADLVRNGDIKHLYRDLMLNDKELGNGSVIMFVSLYKGIPFEPHEPTFLLDPAVQILKYRTELTPEMLQYIEDHRVSMDEIGNVYWEVLEDREENDYGVEGEARVINSKTTFQDLLNYGISMSDILRVLRTNLEPDLEKPVRDYCVLYKLQFSMVKEELTRLLP